MVLFDIAYPDHRAAMKLADIRFDTRRGQVVWTGFGLYTLLACAWKTEKFDILTALRVEHSPQDELLDSEPSAFD